MEKRERNKSEETGQETSHIRDPEIRQGQEVDLEGLQSDLQLQKSEDSTLNKASKLSVTHESQKLMQQENEKSVQKVPLKKPEENKSYRLEFKEFSGDKELEQKTDATKQQNDGSSFFPEQGLNQTNRPETHALNQECGLLSEDTLLESDGNETLQRMAVAPESTLHVPDQESIQLTQQKDNAADQERSAAHESLQTKLEANLIQQLKEKSTEESLNVPLEDPLHLGEQKENDAAQQEYDRSAENPRHFQESESCPEPEESGLAQQEYDRTTENPRYLQESESCHKPEESHLMCLQPLPLPRRICHHRTHVMQRPRLSPVFEEPDLPMTPFQEEILVRRNRRLGARLLSMLPTGLRDSMRRIRERYFPSERTQIICVKLFCSLLIGGVLILTAYFLTEFLENENGSNGDSLTTPSNSPAVTFKPDTSETYLEADTATVMDVNIHSLAADVDAEDSIALNDLNVSTRTVKDFK